MHNINYMFLIDNNISYYLYINAVYLRTSPDVVYQRMKTRARKEENCVSLEYLQQVHNIHDEWLYHQTLFSVPARVLIIDGNKSLPEMVTQFENCKDLIFGKKGEKKN